MFGFALFYIIANVIVHSIFHIKHTNTHYYQQLTGVLLALITPVLFKLVIT